jgi:hypothetical protein
MELELCNPIVQVSSSSRFIVSTVHMMYPIITTTQSSYSPQLVVVPSHTAPSITTHPESLAHDAIKNRLVIALELVVKDKLV